MLKEYAQYKVYNWLLFFIMVEQIHSFVFNDKRTWFFILILMQFESCIIAHVDILSNSLTRPQKQERKKK